MRRFARCEDGTASMEFVIVFPAFMILFVSAFEVGISMTRHVMLERGLDMAVRAVRLGTADEIEYDELKTMICNGAGIIPDCMNSLKLEMDPIDPRNWTNIAVDADCIDSEEEINPVRTFNAGNDNELMILRACVLFKPMFPGTGIGFYLPRKSGDYYALVSSSAFVMEPS